MRPEPSPVLGSPYRCSCPPGPPHLGPATPQPPLTGSVVLPQGPPRATGTPSELRLHHSALLAIHLPGGPAQVHPHLHGRNPGWAGPGLGFLFPAPRCLLSRLPTPRFAPIAAPHEASAHLSAQHPVGRAGIGGGAGLGSGALGWDLEADPAQCPQPRLDLGDGVTSEIWQLPIWVPDGSWPGWGQGPWRGKGEEEWGLLGAAWALTWALHLWVWRSDSWGALPPPSSRVGAGLRGRVVIGSPGPRGPLLRKSGDEERVWCRPPRDT